MFIVRQKRREKEKGKEKENLVISMRLNSEFMKIIILEIYFMEEKIQRVVKQ